MRSLRLSWCFAEGVDMGVETNALSWRKRLQLSQVQVAGRANLTLDKVRRIERGELYRIYLDDVVKLAHWYGGSLADMIPAVTMKPRSRGRSTSISNE